MRTLFFMLAHKLGGGVRSIDLYYNFNIATGDQRFYKNTLMKFFRSHELLFQEENRFNPSLLYQD